MILRISLSHPNLRKPLKAAPFSRFFPILLPAMKISETTSFFLSNTHTITQQLRGAQRVAVAYDSVHRFFFILIWIFLGLPNVLLQFLLLMLLLFFFLFFLELNFGFVVFFSLFFLFALNTWKIHLLFLVVVMVALTRSEQHHLHGMAQNEQTADTTHLLLLLMVVVGNDSNDVVGHKWNTVKHKYSEN